MAKSLHEHKDEFSDWCDLWDQACEKGIFPERPKLDPLPEADFDYGDPSEDYYNNIDRMADEDGLLSESNKDGPNPVMPDSKSKDQSGIATPWVDELTIEAVADLKRQLYDIECKLLAKEAGGSKWQQKPVVMEDKALMKQINSIKGKIDKMSNNLGLKESRRQK